MADEICTPVVFTEEVSLYRIPRGSCCGVNEEITVPQTYQDTYEESVLIGDESSKDLIHEVLISDGTSLADVATLPPEGLFFDDTFAGVANTLIEDHTENDPGTGSYSPAVAHHKLDGSGNLVPNTSTGDNNYINDVVLSQWEPNAEAWFECTLPSVPSPGGGDLTEGGWGIIFLSDIAFAEFFRLRFDASAPPFATLWSPNLGIDSYTGGVDDSSGDGFSFADMSPGSYRFGVKCVSASSFQLWFEPAGGGSRTVIGSITTMPTDRLSTSDHVHMGILASNTVSLSRIHAEQF